MKKKKLIICIAVVVVVFGIIKYRSHSGTPESDAVWVQATPVKQVTLPLETNAIGTLVARSVAITPAIAGHVQQIFFTDGAEVKAGTPLIQLDETVYKAKYESSKAQLVYSKNNYNRMVWLGTKGAIAKQAIEQADADYKEKKADAEENEVMLEKLKLAAPFDGMLGKSNVNLGDYVTIGQSVVTLTDINHLRIEYTIPESYLSSVKLGQTVTITTAAYPGKTFTGKVAFISPTINPDNRSISLYAEIPNNDHLLASGMFANVNQVLGMEQKVLMIPARSLVPIMDGQQVYKVVDGKAYAVNVVIGKRTENSVQILEGLSPKDIVITDGQFKIKNGMSVKIKT